MSVFVSNVKAIYCGACRGCKYLGSRICVFYVFNFIFLCDFPLNYKTFYRKELRALIGQYGVVFKMKDTGTNRQARWQLFFSN